MPRVRFRVSPKRKKSKILSMFSPAELLRGSLSDPPFILSILFLLVFGWVMVYSASAMIAENRLGNQYYFLKRQLMWSAIGVVAFFVTSAIPTRLWQKLTRPFYFFTITVLLAVLFLGPEISGARRWLRAGGFSFQPSELAKLCTVFLAADYMDRRQSRLKEFKKGLLPLLVMAGIPIGLILMEPDLGTPVLIISVLTALLIIGGARWSHLFLMGAAMLPALIFFLFQFKYRVARLFAYLDPWRDPQGTGYQLVQSLLALGSGGIFGKGLGQSDIKIRNLPDPHTDFIFAVLGEELGLIGTLLCAGLFLFLCMRGLRYARCAPNMFSRLVAAGISLTIGFQGIINMGVASGLFPTKGMPLPFISFGGTSLVMVFAALGILTNISRQGRNPNAKAEI